MKKCVRRLSLFTFIFSLIIFVPQVFADATNNLASFTYIATNSNILQDINGLTSVKIVKPDAWYKSNTGLWYYFENDWTTTRTGWFVDPMDEQTYYLNPGDGVMAVGWTKIDGNEYYFKDVADGNDTCVELGLGFYVRLGKGIKTYGSLYKDCMTPDGKMVDADGKLISN